MPAALWPYVLPYFALLGLAELGRWWPGAEAPLLAARVLGPALLLAHYWRRGAYPELRARAGPPDVAFGLAVAALWVGPYVVWPSLPRGESFDPDRFGAEGRAAWLALRVAGFVFVSPLVEELFVRSFLHRAAEAWPAWASFASRPLAQPSLRAFLVTTLWFTLSHVPWEWWVAIPTGAALNLWLYTRGGLTSVWLAHAVTNGAIAALVLVGPGDLWAFL